jgi:hypothetical protein
MRAAFSRIGSKISCDANTVTGALVCAALIGRRVFILAAAIVAAIAIVNRLRQRDPVSAAEPATAIGDGLAAAFATLPASGPRGIVLVTDGTNNRGEDPGEVANRLRAAHVRLDIIGIGPGALSERALRSYAREAGGSFVRIRSADQFPTEMKRLAFEAAMLRKARDCSPAFAIAGLFLVTAAWLAAQRGAFRL